MTKTTGFHVRHDLHPIFAFELLMLLRGISVEQTEEELRAAAYAQGFTLRQRKSFGKLLKSLEELGIVEKSRKSVALTERGQIIAEAVIYQRPLLGELIHFLYYTLFDTDNTLRFSWSYHIVCQHLWTTAPSTINRDRLVNIVTHNAIDDFSENSISFSTQSVLGILYWIESLCPTCLDESGKLFSRRLYCPLETFVLALNHVYEQHSSDSLSVLLTPEIRQEVCQICLIVPEAFQDMLEQAETSFTSVQIRRERGERLIMTGFSWDFLKE